MAIGNITTGQQTVTGTGAVTATTGLDISGITGDCTVHYRVQGLSAVSGTPKATIAVEDSVNAFTAAVTVGTKQIQGPVASNAEVAGSFRKYELPNCRFGTASAVLRVNVTVLAGTTPSLTLDAWLEY
jgi:hypothetical protein